MSENGHGGKREGAGRKSNMEKALAALPNATELLSAGHSPLELMLIALQKSWQRAVMAEEDYLNDDGKDKEKLKAKQQSALLLEKYAFERACAVAPYCHPKLVSAKQEGQRDDAQAAIPMLPEDMDM